jgi:hypothetical protein
MPTILKPKDGTYILPAIADTSDLFKYIAGYNGFDYYDTDSTGVTPNEIKPSWFFINRIDVFTPVESYGRARFDGVLFIGQPASLSVDVNSSTYNNGQFVDIVKALLNLPFAVELKNYVACDFEININNLRPLYNSVRYTKAEGCTGVEVNYSIWI